MNIAIFASGTGTNAEALIRRFNGRGGSSHRVALVLTNRSSAPVIERARKLGVEAVCLSREELADETVAGLLLESRSIGFVALAGFLAMVPVWMVRRYAGRMVNLHPSLLPRHGGPGMWGRRVHEAVIAAGDTESGITLHLVDEDYDTGLPLFQAHIPIAVGNDTPESLEARIHPVEHRWYPALVGALLRRIE